eukprot:CAMPEP_0175973358 /NCGR_PEP_ID=MMETSP0108-20121206/42745_1 /TAXON_ID=195067 ORGANISM="Goniomonas pacifica, Strain CCMP1869" /NCGR_SAMPLE_ID=MMETSP0108 /ASSEMBLY_ACC=CAM_ASM_000204 /LENGTH=453 /DNA_ID=CAMNT_0017302787 /DNA_START=144 /DNA_END=1505 /DNA_ORIENTATION=-
MHQWAKIYGTCRVPGDPVDESRRTDDSRHIVVFTPECRAYRLQVLDQERLPLCEQDILEALRHIASESKAAGTAPSVAALTTADRGTWAQARALLVADPVSAASVEAIETALFVVSLAPSPPPADKPDYWKEASCPSSHGYRWHDTAIQYCFYPGGGGSCSMEHSELDGAPPVQKNEMIADWIVAGSEGPCQSPVARPADNVTPLPFNPSPAVLEMIPRVIADTETRRADYEVNLVAVDGVGKEDIKVLSVSPDAFVQLSLQLAHRRATGRSVATYESVGTVGFYHGRTETMRSATPDAVAMAIADEKQVAKEELGALVRKAAAMHSKAIGGCAMGMGIDRHLLGLQMMAKTQADGTPPALFQHPLFQRSQTWLLSSSQLTAPKSTDFLGFRAVEYDGLGVCYQIQDHVLKFTVTSFKGSAHSDGPKFAAEIERAVRFMHGLLTDCPAPAQCQ